MTARPTADQPIRILAVLVAAVAMSGASVLTVILFVVGPIGLAAVSTCATMLAWLAALVFTRLSRGHEARQDAAEPLVLPVQRAAPVPRDDPTVPIVWDVRPAGDPFGRSSRR